MENWNCCPSGQVWESDGITSLEEGSTISGSIEIEEEGRRAHVRSWTEAKEVLMRIQSRGRVFDWMDLTQEVYGVANCYDFADGWMNISNVHAAYLDGSDFNPRWVDATGTSDCEGRQALSGDSWAVHHSNGEGKWYS